MTLALLCSGQGLQGRAMFRRFADDRAARPVIHAAGQTLGGDLAQVLANCPDTTIHGNHFGQILCVARALASAACLRLPSSFLIAGYSVGEMAAWSVAGFWSVEDCLRLTALRAELMDTAGGEGGGLGFVRGLAREQVERIVATNGCAIAIVNPEKLFIIGGTKEQVEQCCDAARAQGAISARPINVMVASHTPRLTAAVAPFAATLQSTPLANALPGRTLVSASHASVVAGESALADLSSQVATCIDWATTLEALVERGATRMLELGPGTALAEMARSVYPSLDIRSLDEFHTNAGASLWLERD